MHKNIVFYFEENKDGRFLNDFFAEYISKFPEIEMNGIEFLGNNYYGVIGNKCGFWKEHEVNKEDVYFAPSMYPLYFEHPVEMYVSDYIPNIVSYFICDENSQIEKVFMKQDKCFISFTNKYLNEDNIALHEWRYALECINIHNSISTKLPFIQQQSNNIDPQKTLEKILNKLNIPQKEIVNFITSLQVNN